jgi:hypothetical protein
MDKIYEVWSIALSDGKRHSWSAFRTRDEAEQFLSQRTTGDNEAWATRYHGKWWIEEVDTTGLFQIPHATTPRERFMVEVTEIETGPGALNTLRIDVKNENNINVATYSRNYPAMYRTFEPFHQSGKMFALISSDYTCTSVLDLQTGEVIASEEPSSMGFCPVGFYVPDWWDINDDSILPGSNRWSPDNELPKGDFGFVWGCVWGDDSSWKIQYLDLSLIQSGQIKREERFGYLKLASHSKLDAKEFINCYFVDGKCKITFAVEQTYDLETGELIDD